MAGRGKARVVIANRAQLSWDLINPDGWLAPDHRARLVVGFVETLDLTVLYDKVEAREGTAGRPAADPAVLFALWLLATMDGVGSARELDRLTIQDLAYRWVACGVPVNYHGLADFRVAHADVLDDLLTKTLAAFLAERLFDADEIVVDGTKIKASAGKSSYKRASRLDEAEGSAKARVAALKAEVDADPAASSKRTQAARARGLNETQQRIEKARIKLAEIEAEKAKRAKQSPKEVAGQKEARASLTDPEARRMKCADGAVRASYNVQIAATTDHGFVTAVMATDRRNDSGLVRPMSEESEQRLGRPIKRVLADTGFAQVDDIAALASRPEAPIGVYIHPPKDRDDVKPATLLARQKQREKESQIIKDWRQRMITNEAETIMKKRGRIERVNANFKNRGFGTLLVRGLAKVQAIALWHALAHNLTIALRLRATPSAAA
ncbi:MAG: transposase [Burkholderiaceae bacterium]